MTKNYQQLWKGATNATDRAEAVQTLAEMVADSDGRAFILDLKPEDVVLCIEILDYVGCDLRLACPLPHMVSLGHRSVQS